MRQKLGISLLVLGAVLAAFIAIRHLSKAGQGSSLIIPRGEGSVLLITTDTTRADHLGPYGAENIQTPSLDRLAAEGIVVERAFATAPITLVAHSSIHSGLYPPQHGVRNNGIHHLSKEITTAAEIFSDNGYRTAAFISAAVLEKRYGLDQGFELYDDDLSTGRERHPRMVPDRPADATVASVSRWLEGIKDDERFFVWVHFYDPHAAYSPPPPFRDRYRGRLYDGEIAFMDQQIGRLLNNPNLASRKDLSVFVIGDHGESLGEHGEKTHAILDYDSTLHVPWIMKLAGGPAGVRYRPNVSQVDFLPTVLDLEALNVPTDLPGISLLRRMEDQGKSKERALYSETYLPYYTYGWARVRSLRRGWWKYISAPAPELYDLKRDPRELSNIVLQESGLAHDMRGELDAMVARLGGDRENKLELDAESRAKLQALGYLAGGDIGQQSDEMRPDPKDVIGLHVNLEKARAFLRDRLYAEAEISLRTVLSKDPRNLAALTEMANAQVAQGRLEDAMSTLSTALNLSPDSPSLLLAMARVETSRHDSEAALKLLDQAISLDGNFQPATMMKASILARSGRRHDASRLLNEALEKTPDNPELQTAIARLIEMPGGKLKKAETRLRAALKRDPFLVQAYRLLGDVLEHTGRSAEALKTYQEGLRRQVDDVELHGKCGMLLAEMGRWPEAEAHLREALRLSPSFRSEYHVALGGVLAQQGRLSEARREYELVLAKDPKNPDARNNRAIALYRSGRSELALVELRELLKEHPRHADALNNMAVIAVDQKRWKEAEAFARRAVKAQVSMAEGWNNLGIALDEQGRLNSAKDAYQRGLEQEESYWPARLNLAITLRKLGRAQDAVAELQRILTEGPDHPEVHLELGDLEADILHHPDLARAHYNAFLRLAPSHPRAAEIRHKLAGL